MSYSLSKYYIEQAETGVDFFNAPLQKGNGYFGRFHDTSIKPMLSSFVPILKDTAIHGATQAVKHISTKLRGVERKTRVKRKPRVTRKKKRNSTGDYF